MDLTVLLTENLLMLAGAFVLLWAASLVVRDVSIVDLFWGLSFVAVAWWSYWRCEPATLRPLVLAVAVTLWGSRLSAYLTYRNWGKPEDHRYAAMRDHHGRRFPLVSLFTVFLLQAALAWLISWPLQTAMAAGGEWGLLPTLGLVLWAIGLTFEAVGDWQLARFKADPANDGKVMQHGLWRYTRHPNYFGDFLVWWGFYLMAASPGTWWWIVLGPVVMSVLLMRVSGVTLLEKSLKQRKPDYEEYARRTSSFFPLPPKANNA